MRKINFLKNIKIKRTDSNRNPMVRIGFILGLFIVFTMVIVGGGKYSEKVQVKNKQLISKLEIIDNSKKEEEAKINKENEKIKKAEEKLKLEKELILIKNEIMELDEEFDLEYATNSIENDIKYYKEILENIKLESELKNDDIEDIEDINENTQTNIEPNIPITQEPVTIKPVVPAIKPQVPAVKPEVPAVKPEVPAVKPEVPAVKPEEPAVKPEEPNEQEVSDEPEVPDEPEE